MTRADFTAALTARIGRRQLVWFGTRGDDVEPATELPQLAASFSVIAPYRRRPSVASLALEQLSGVRVDLDAHDIDEEPREGPAAELRRAMLRTLARPSVVFTYRPSRFVSAICFARQDRCEYAGLFKDHQSAFEHKPWVESEVARLGLPRIPWTYVADEEQIDTLAAIRSGPVMLRRSRTSGGTGLVRVDDEAELRELWPRQDESYVSVAPFISGGVPVNVGAVVWDDEVTVHPASVQLIGIDGCTVRPFGYCGNDFAAAALFGGTVLDAIETSTRTVGRWLGRHGYRGAFGVDYLVVNDVPLFTEVNPRFQGSTHASCQLSVQADESCLVLEHLGALLGMPAPRRAPLREQVRRAAPLSHLVVHWVGSAPTHADGGGLVDVSSRVSTTRRVDLVADPRVTTLPGATVARVTAAEQITANGFELFPTWRSVVDDWSGHQLATTSREGRTP